MDTVVSQPLHTVSSKYEQVPPKFAPLDYDKEWSKDLRDNLFELDFLLFSKGWDLLEISEQQQQRQQQ